MAKNSSGENQRLIPSASIIFAEALKNTPNGDVNSLHSATWEILKKYISDYYQRKIDDFLAKMDLDDETKKKIKNGLMEPVIVDNKEYSNFMEETAVRLRQSVQPLSGQLAELCVENELKRSGLILNFHYTKRQERTDFTIYHPDIKSKKSTHRVEVKNVCLRERGARGLKFDGDSLFGFFNEPDEFSDSNIEVMDKLCTETNGYIYVPPNLLEEINSRLTKERKGKPKRFKPNIRFGQDMAAFCRTGSIPP